MTFNKVLTHLLLAINFLGLPVLAQEAQVLGHDTYGEGPNKVIVLHDWMGDLHNYEAVRPWLDTSSFTYVFADVRGYGESIGMSGNYTTDEVAGDVFALADHLGWDEFGLVGHSMNGMAGFKALLRDWNGDQRITGFVAVTPVTPDGYPATEDDKAFLLSSISDDETAKTAFGAFTGDKLNQAWGSRKTQRHRKSSRPEALHGYYDMWLGEDFSEELHRASVGTPVFVIGGKNDFPGFQKAYYDQTIAHWLPNIAFAYIDNAGHYPMHETPILFAALVEEYLAAAVVSKDQ